MQEVALELKCGVWYVKMSKDEATLFASNKMAMIKEHPKLKNSAKINSDIRQVDFSL